jgi:FixJ family two-component response regulator
MNTPLIRVGLVDDEPRTLKTFRWEFGEDFEIKTFLGGVELLSALDRGECIDVLISDQRMPGMAGHEVLKVVGNRFPAMGRLVTTAYADVAPLQSCVNEAGIDGYLDKPWDPDEVRALIRRAYDRHLEDRSLAEKRASEAEYRWQILQESRREDVAKVCSMLQMEEGAESEFFRAIASTSDSRSYDWSDLLLIEPSQERALALDFLSTVESLVALGSEVESSSKRLLFYWWLLIRACGKGKGSSFYRHGETNEGVTLYFDAGYPFGDSILDPLGDRDDLTIRKNALLLLVANEVKRIGGALRLDPDRDHFAGELFCGSYLGGLL